MIELISKLASRARFEPMTNYIKPSRNGFIDVNETFSLAFKSIWRNKTRSALTMLGIIIGVGAVILLVSLGQGLQSYITGQFEQLGTNLVVVLPGKVSIEQGFQGPPNFAGSKLTLKQANAIARLGGPVDDAGAAIEIPSSIQYRGKSKYTTVAGITSNYGNIRNIHVSIGREINSSDVELARKVALLGQGITNNLFGQSEAIGKQISIGQEKFEVVGILDKIGSGGIGFDVDNFVAVPITSGQHLSGNNNVQAITVKSINKEVIPDTIKVVKTYLKRELTDDDFSVIDQGSLVTSINQILGVLTAALGGIAAISLVVGGVGIMNIMLVSVTERTREIGLRKAVGAKPNDILLQFLTEAIVLSTFGGGIGILIGWLGSEAAKKVIPATVTLGSVLLAFGVSAAVGIIFGVAPAIRASRLNPIDALRYE